MPFKLYSKRYRHFRSRNPLIITKINNQSKLSDFEYLSNENWLKLLFRRVWIYLAIPIRLLYFILQKKAGRNVTLFLLVQLSSLKKKMNLLLAIKQKISLSCYLLAFLSFSSLLILEHK